jgi:hypothetical protein
MLVIRKYNIYINKELRIRGYFWNPKGTREQNNLGNIGRDETCRNLVVRVVSSSARDHLVAAVDGTKVCQYFNKDSVFDLSRKQSCSYARYVRW